MIPLLKPFTGTGAVFFPEGPPPRGTCEFATITCEQHCYVNDHSNFDEETRVPLWEKQLIYARMLSRPLPALRAQMLADLQGLQTPILHWFATGDCPAVALERVSTLIGMMPPDVVQMGFTRNRKLWERHKDVFALTVERTESFPDSNAMYSVPHYDKETSVMYCPSYQVRGGFCGPHLCQDIDRDRAELTHYINCRTCHRLKLGCFDRRSCDER
jgi:hypothetical protein